MFSQKEKQNKFNLRSVGGEGQLQKRCLRMGDNLQEELPAGEKLKGRLVNMGTINGGAERGGIYRGKTPSSWLSGGIRHHGRG